VHPAIRVDSFGSVLGVVEVALEDVVATEAELTTGVGLVLVGVLNGQ
jgi:F420-0:gamma-glutamyl ligase